MSSLALDHRKFKGQLQLKAGELCALYIQRCILIVSYSM